MTTNDCQVWEKNLIDCISGDSLQLADRALLRHAAECPSCGDLLWIHLRLSAAEPDIPMPTAAQFGGLRRAVLRQLPASVPPAVPRYPEVTGAGTLRSLISSLFLNPLFAYALLVMMVLSTAIFSGRTTSTPQSWQALLESEIGRQALRSDGLQASSDSPYILSNLSIRQLPAQRFSLEFDVTTHLETVRNQDDPLVREALAQSLMSSSNLGAKLRAISFAEELPGRKVTEGLIYAALHDQNPAVRLSSLGVLTQFDDDPLVQRACLEILTGDDSVQMRLIAIDYLGRNPEILREAIDQRWSRDPALRLRAATYLQ